MCNSLDHNSKKIPEEGTGYKIFSLKNNKLEPVFNQLLKPFPINKWIKWKKRNSYEGFCFFLNKKDAKKYLDILPPDLILKIIYKKGLGKQKTYSLHLYKKVEIAICKEFKILPNQIKKGVIKYEKQNKRR